MASISIVDHLLFGVPLTEFTAHRNRKDPSTVDWSSDGCTSSPDNPFCFSYLPACYRHDFGYQNYRIQERFTKDAKAKIDLNFKKDLYFQCQAVPATQACQRLADVYYTAVRLFGGGDARIRALSADSTGPDEQRDLVKAYQDTIVAYNEAVKEAQEQGLLPVLD
ncbi:erythromycin esterase [Purpureocillium lavendulum]|uniref:Erythromycin esterase n=1 Tax=Purpureocillium lavendulum TaxID=1247861 RepID=A0AB34FJ22_9HYPO|nr:erythromycin esterase [Purpureocillium lavendulum]